jgi:hypothetical protein
MQTQLPTQQWSKLRETQEGQQLSPLLRPQRSRRKQQGQMLGSQQSAAAQMTAAPVVVMMTRVCRRRLNPSFDVAAPVLSQVPGCYLAYWSLSRGSSEQYVLSTCRTEVPLLRHARICTTHPLPRLVRTCACCVESCSGCALSRM